MRNLMVMSVCFFTVSGCSARSDASYSGYVEAQSVSIAAPQSGWLTEVSVDRGDTVALDQLLFRLDDSQAQNAVSGAQGRALAAQASATDLSKGARDADIAPLLAQREQAQAALDLAKANEARYAQLEPKGYVSAAQMDALRSTRKSAASAVVSIDKQISEKRLAARSDQIKAAQATAAASGADMASAQWTLADREVHARLTGQIDERLREPGEFVAAGTPVLTVRPKGREFVRFFVPQAVLSQVQVGRAVKIHCDGCPPLSGKVRYIAANAEFTPPVIYSVKERQKLMYLIEVAPDQPEGLHAGQPVDVTL